MVHGCSAAVMSVVGSLARKPKERDPLLGGEQERLYGMQDDSPEENEEETESDSI
jgi:hypothetical protein